MAKLSEIDRFIPGHSLALFGDGPDVVVTVHGSLGFLDISGFTALSERLAALGRVGAEELTEVLGRVFGDMIDLASQRGGTLLKFGGDAMLMLFESKDHAMQAASAAVEMRTILRKAAEIPTSVGRVRLRMSQGVHSGEIHLFRAVGVHTELIVAGPAATWVTKMEGAADDSEIVVSTATRALLPDDSAAKPKGDGWLLKWRSARAAPCGIVGMDTGESGQEKFIPVALREYLVAGNVESEHRQAIVAFVKISEIDDRMGAVGVGTAAIELTDLITAFCSIADEEGVTFLATDVDENASKVILVSGVPSTEIDEGGRMLRTVRLISDVDTPFTVKIGVNGGHVFSGEVGSSHRSTFTIMGDTVNLAARMMSAAPPGEIYVSPAVIDASTTLYEAEEVEPFPVKGKTKPVRALSVGIETGPRSDKRSSQGVFLGRDQELTQLRAMRTRLEGGVGGAVVVSGPTGIGKTRLVEELLATSTFRILDVRGEPYGSANPYRPFRDLVRSLVGVERGENDAMAAGLVDAVDTVAPELLPLAPLIADIAHIEMPPTNETRPIGGRFWQERAADVLIELFHAILPEPAIFVAEDMHWADAPSQALLARLAREASSSAWLVVVTGREYSIPGVVNINLEPLDDAAVAEIIHAGTEMAPFRPDVVSAIVDRAGGSPLFAEELVLAVRETGEVSSLPTSLDGVVGSQIDSLAPRSRRVLRYLSVLGRSFRSSVARDLIETQGADLDDATRETLAAFLEDDGPNRLRFRHALVRDVAYEGLAFRRRKNLHLRAGQIVMKNLGDSPDNAADILALHFYLGGDAERAWQYSTIAGDKNMATFANIEAAAQFERAIEASRRLASIDDDARRDLYVKLGDVRERSGEFEASLLAYRAAARLAGSDPLAKGTVLLKRARAKERAGSYAAALADTTRVSRLIDTKTSHAARELAAHALSYVALIRQAQQKPRHALEAATEAVEAAEAVGSEIALARALSVLDYALVMQGDLEAAVNSERSLEIYKRLEMREEEAQIAQNLGVYDYWRGDWESAIRRYRQGRETLTALGNAVEAAHAAANLGEVFVNQGRHNDAEEPLLFARRTYLASHFDEGLAFVSVLLGRMEGQRGNLDVSEAYLSSARDTARRLGLEGYVLEASVYMADAERRAGSPDRGLEILDRAASDAPPDYMEHYSPFFHRVKGSILHAAGQLPESLHALEAGLEFADERDDRYEAALLAVTIDRISLADVDAPRLERARETLRTLGVRSDLGIEVDS